MFFLGLHKRNSPNVKPPMIKFPPIVQPRTLSSFVYTPFNSTEYAVCLSWRHKDFKSSGCTAITASNGHRFCRRSCQKRCNSHTKPARGHIACKTCDRTHMCTKPAAIPALLQFLHHFLRRNRCRCKASTTTPAAIPAIAIPAAPTCNSCTSTLPLAQNLLQILRRAKNITKTPAAIPTIAKPAAPTCDFCDEPRQFLSAVRYV